MKRYEVFDQRFPFGDRKKGWRANLVSVGTVEARDLEHALRLAKTKARFPMVHNDEDFAEALRDEKREKAIALAEAVEV